MPQFHAMVSRANSKFNRDNIHTVPLELFAPGTDLGTSLRTLGIAGSADQETFIGTFEVHDREALRAYIYSSLTANPRVEIQFLWMEAGHREVRIQSMSGDAQSRGAMSVFIQSPKP
jgi:hypothetical protein